MSLLEYLPGLSNLQESLRGKSVAVMEGAVFQAANQTGALETAKVVSIGPDTMGIDHVTYDLEIRKPTACCLAERRVLNLQSFKNRYPKAL
ncbi:hypothetical protein ACTL6U_03030 [Rhodovibrionaceae bacterium A322]